MKLYKLSFLVIYFAGVIQLSCNDKFDRYSKQFEVVNKLLNSFLKNDTSAVGHMMGVPLENIGTNFEIINSEVMKAGDLLREYGMPDKDKYILKEYPDKSPELVDILVPVVAKGNGKGRLIEAGITFSFVKYIPSNKIIIFHVNTKYKPTIIRAPESQ
jgi:hypothetical protein